jgi:preprotein translocase subunit SecF
MRLRLVKQQTAFDFFEKWKLWLGVSALLVVLSIASTVTLAVVASYISITRYLRA